MQTDERPVTVLERLDREGGPIPFVDPGDMKKMWQLERDRPCPANTATGFSTVARLGLSDSTLDGVSVLGVRLMLLRDLLERGTLHDHLVDGEISDEIFQAVATVPCNWEDFFEAHMQLVLKRSSEDTSETREMFLAHGYNLDRPEIDAKFLAWMRDQC